MPLYEYTCRVCGHRFETLRSISLRTHPAKCPQCGREEGQLELSAPAAFAQAGHNVACNTGGG